MMTSAFGGEHSVALSKFTETAEALLPQITEHYIIVRGFAFAPDGWRHTNAKEKKMSRSLKDLKKLPIT